VSIALAIRPERIERVAHELDVRARDDPNRCFGYFPGMAQVPHIEHDLPASRAFAQDVPSLRLEEKDLFFNFLRLSRMKQPAKDAFHLDSDAATALTGDQGTLTTRLVLRLLLNLSAMLARTVAYADVDASTVRIRADGGYLFCYDTVPAAAVRRVILPPRQGLVVSGLLLCTNRVLHAGVDDDEGHFVAAYGREDVLGTRGSQEER
jgi:hypothetical protein